MKSPPLSRTKLGWNQYFRLSISIALLSFMLSCLATTVMTLDAISKVPDAIRDGNDRRFTYRQEELGVSIMRDIRGCGPEELEGWTLIPYDIHHESDKFYSPINLRKLIFDYRRPDGSDNINITIIINPPLTGMKWYQANPYIPDSSRTLLLPSGAQGWIHESYPWNFFLPSYDMKTDSPRACVAQIYIGDWRQVPTSEIELQIPRLEDQRWQASILERSKNHPELISPNGIVDPALIPVSLLSPILYTPSSKEMKPNSIPDHKTMNLYPHCIAIQIVGKNEPSVLKALDRFDIKSLSKLTNKR